MITRSDIIWLGVSSGVMGALVGGLMLGVGMAMVIEGGFLGFIFIIPGGPVAGLSGWLMSRRLAKQARD
jgi:predicted lipid-binding transport protein (Tim44 family)